MLAQSISQWFKREWPQIATGNAQVGCLEAFTLIQSDEELVQAAQGSDGFTVPGCFKKRADVTTSDMV